MKTSFKVGLSGSSGRMGKALKEVIKTTQNISIAEEAHTKRNPFDWDSKKVQGVIDFSLPPLFLETLSWCVKYKKPLVSGTTGLNETQRKEMIKASKKIPIFYSENMSFGIWFLKQGIQNLPVDFNSLCLTDIHHKSKKDSPSGTALYLKSFFPKKIQPQLKIKSLRKGMEFGVHEILCQWEDEEILLRHQALSRNLFAKGALKALLWLLKKPAGFYSLDHIYKKA